MTTLHRRFDLGDLVGCNSSKLLLVPAVARRPSIYVSILFSLYIKVLCAQRREVLGSVKSSKVETADAERTYVVCLSCPRLLLPVYVPVCMCVCV